MVVPKLYPKHNNSVTCPICDKYYNYSTIHTHIDTHSEDLTRSTEGTLELDYSDQNCPRVWV